MIKLLKKPKKFINLISQNEADSIQLIFLRNSFSGKQIISSASFHKSGQSTDNWFTKHKKIKT
jgi:hypothetical protein